VGFKGVKSPKSIDTLESVEEKLPMKAAAPMLMKGESALPKGAPRALTWNPAPPSRVSVRTSPPTLVWLSEVNVVFTGAVSKPKSSAQFAAVEALARRVAATIRPSVFIWILLSLM
jgi:hypothetical protein